jgi:hypothetical protein
MSRFLLSAALIVYVASSCTSPFDSHMAEGDLKLDFATLVTANTMQCVWTGREAILFVDGRRARRVAVNGNDESATFDRVRVGAGTVRFDVRITSDNDSILYEGTATEEITGSGFSVVMQLAKADGVLQVCPGEVVLADGAAETRFVMQNRGSRVLLVRIESSVMCANEPCHSFYPDELIIPAGQGAAIDVLVKPDTPATTMARVNTNAGGLDLPIRRTGP